MTVTIAKWTLEQYHQMIAAGVLDQCAVELLNGEIIEMPPEGEPHAYFRTELKDELAAKLGRRAKIRDAAPITIPQSQSEPEPDIAVVHPLGREYLQHHPYPENVFWLIEFSKTSLTKDLDAKVKTYASANIPEYWVVDLKNRKLIVFRQPVDGDYQDRQELTQGDICSLAFPDISFAVKSMLA